MSGVSPNAFGLMLAGGTQMSNYISNRETNATNKEINADQMAYDKWKFEEQNAFNSNMAKTQAQWSEDMYNKYASPVALKRQYEEAGLNPALMMQGQNIGSLPSAPAGASAGSGGSPSSIPAIPYQMNIDSSLISVMQDAALKDAQTRKIDEEARAAGISADYREQQEISDLFEKLSRTKKYSAEYDVLRDELAVRLRTRDARVEQQMYQTDAAKANVALVREQKEQVHENVLSMRLSRQLQIDQNSREWQRLYSDLSEAKARITRMAYENHLTETEVENVIRDSAKKIAEKNSIELDNAKRGLEADRSSQNLRKRNNSAAFREVDGFINWLSGSILGKINL